MPSLRTWIMHDRATVAPALADAAEAVADATADLEAIADGTLNLEAVMIGGTRFINDGGTLVAEP